MTDLPKPSETTLRQAEGIYEAHERRRAALREWVKWGLPVAEAIRLSGENVARELSMSGDHRPRPITPCVTIADRARDFLAGHADESIESLLEDVIEYVEACEGER